jgi:hypothetical protein
MAKGRRGTESQLVVHEGNGTHATDSTGFSGDDQMTPSGGLLVADGS